MRLFQRRQQQREKAERAARGESIPLTRDFDQKVRTRIFYAIRDNSPEYLGELFGRPSPEKVFAEVLRTVLLSEWGEVTLTNKADPADDFATFVVNVADNGQMLDIIESFFKALDQVESRFERPQWERAGEAQKFRERVNEVLDDHDIAFQIIGHEVIPRESMAMYTDVVKPALSLLSGEARLTNVERAFHDALRELKPGGNAADAITDAGTALQEMLVALGAKGNALGPLLHSARQKELLGPYDSKLAEGVQKIGDWVSADRSARGDAHLVKESDTDDAWLAVHVVGALILRLERRL